MPTQYMHTRHRAPDRPDKSDSSPNEKSLLMGMSRKAYTDNFLFALNIFIAFLLLFETKLAIPQWLQPLGRMHPLILHFPIVLLLLAMGMEFFRFGNDYQRNPFYQRFSTALLLGGVITSGMAVTMGIFLSQEEGYSADALQLHKWTGAGVFFIASAIYTWRDAKWYNQLAARAGGILIVLCLLVSGHFGGALTHGDNFILKPVLAEERTLVPIEEALVFDHVIKPVLDRKCMSCHNAAKQKGELLLTDSASILRGGETGASLVPGKPGESLLVSRIYLPEAEEEHMPPSGKLQLTAEEKDLLSLWIRSGAQFSTRVYSLSESDSLRVAATNFLTRRNEVETFPFPAADNSTLQRLNSNYRVITPVAINSPALTVNVYNKNVYTPATLDELKDVRLQIIALDLGKMPVRNEDVKYIARFENLRQLNLNFTEVTGEILAQLSGLENLTSLSLSGTNVGYADLRQFLPLFKKLETVAVWDTNLSASEAEKLQVDFRHLAVLGGVNWSERPLIKLNAPRLRNKALVFADSISAELFHGVNGADIRFTTDGSEPDSVSSTLFKGTVVLTESTEIRARAFKAGWLSSDASILHVYSSKHKPDSAILLSRLNRVHTANGAQTFFDHQLGSFNANSPAWANNWGGVINNDLELLLRFDKSKRVTSVSVNSLVETENFIFPPAAIEIWGGPSESSLSLIHRCAIELPATYSKPFIKLYECEFEAQDVSRLKVIVKPVMEIPDWHKRKDRPALLLVDEILVN